MISPFLLAIMNKVTTDSQYLHLETMLRTRQDLRSIYKSLGYADGMKTWTMFGGDNEQSATLENMEWSGESINRLQGFD